MELTDLRGLLALADTGSIKAAAVSLGLSRATLRRRIQSLEQDVGVALVSAGESRVALTDAGALCVREGRRLVRDSDDLAALVRSAGTEPTGVLRIATPIGSAGPEIGMALRWFAAHVPQLRFELRFTDDPAGALLDGADAAVLFGSYPMGDWTVSSLGTAGLGAYAHRNYLARSGPLATVEDLASHRLLHGTAVPLPSSTWPLTSGGTVAIEPWLATTDLDVVRQSVQEGLGIGLILDDLADDLVRVLPHAVGMEVPLWALTTPFGAKRPRVRAFLDAARAYMAS